MQKRPWLWNEQLWRRKGIEDDREGGMVRPFYFFPGQRVFYFKSFKLVLAQWGYRNIICYCHLSEASEVKLTTSFVFPRWRNSMTVVFALG